MQNKAICAVSFRNAVQSMPKNSLQHIQKRRIGSRADCITPEMCRQKQPGTIAPNWSSLSRSARAGFFAALRSGELTAGSQLPYLSCQRSAFCDFLRIFQPNCTKLLLCEIIKTTKTAHLLAFCKHAVFQTNFCQ